MQREQGHQKRQWREPGSQEGKEHLTDSWQYASQHRPEQVELLGLRTHPDSPAPEYVCSFVKEMHKAQRPEITNHTVVPFALFPKGQSLAFCWR